MNPLISLIIPTRNENKSIRKCLSAIYSLDYPQEKMEIIIVDGMSEDSTRNYLKQEASAHSNVRLFDNPRKITSAAFNIGIKESKGKIIAIVSAHSYLNPDYLKECLSCLCKTGAGNVGGPMIAVADNFIGKAVSFVHNDCFFGFGGGKFHHSDYEGCVDTVYLGFYPKETFNKIGLFNEKLIRNQDIELNFRLRKAGFKIYLSPKIKSTYFCRSSLSGLWDQNFKNGFWNIITVKQTTGSLSMRHFVPLFFVVFLIVSLLLGLLFRSAMILFSTMLFAYVLASLAFSFVISLKKGWRYFWIMPLVFGCLHFGCGFGSLWGVMKWHVLGRGKSL